MEELVKKVIECLKKGETLKSLELLFDLSSSYSRSHLHEVTSQIARYNLISKNDRLGTISLDDLLRLESQVSSSVLKMLASIEDNIGTNKASPTEIEKTRVNLQNERDKRIDIEYRLNKLEKRIDEKKASSDSNNIIVREEINGERVELKIISISKSVTNSKLYALILKEVDGPYRYPIIIGEEEAKAIAVKMEGIKPARPMTQDLLNSIIDIHGSTLESVTIDTLQDGIHFAKLTLLNSGKIIEVDSRTSDAVCIAAAHDVPIYTYKHIIELAGIILEEEDESE